MPGANHTKMLLAASLQELMSSVPLEKISVNDIVERAGVGRNTFYYHFEDKYDLVNWYFQTGMTHFMATRTNYSNWQTLLTGLEDYLRENKIFYTNALHYNGQNSLRECVFDFCSSLFSQRLDDLAQNTQKEYTSHELRFAGDFLAGAVMGILMRWIDRGMKDHIADYYSCLHTICSGSLINDFFPFPGESAAAAEYTTLK